MVKIIRLLLAAAVAFAATGCLSIRGDIKLDRKAHASGNVTIEISKQLANFAGITSVDQLKQQYVKEELREAKITETDAAYRISGPIDPTLDDPTGIFAAVENVDPSTQTLSSRPTSTHRVHFSMNLGDQSAPVADAEDPFGMGDINVGSIDLTVKFPGKVEAVTPANAWERVDDKTYRLKTRLTTTTMNQTYDAYSAIDPPLSVAKRLLPLWIAGGVVLVLGTTGLLLWRRRRSQTTSVDVV
jgi:hypothetical protein